MSTTGSPWDGDVRRPRRVRIRRPDDRGAGAWRGPDSPRPPAPRHAASYPAEPEYAGRVSVRACRPSRTYPEPGPGYVPSPPTRTCRPPIPTRRTALYPYDATGRRTPSEPDVPVRSHLGDPDGPRLPTRRAGGHVSPLSPYGRAPRIGDREPWARGPPRGHPYGPPRAYPYPAYPVRPDGAGPARPPRAYPYEPSRHLPVRAGPITRRVPHRAGGRHPYAQAPYPPGPSAARPGPYAPGPYALDAAPILPRGAARPRRPRRVPRTRGGAARRRPPIPGLPPSPGMPPGPRRILPAGYQQVPADHGQAPRFGREAAGLPRDGRCPGRATRTPAWPGIPGTAPSGDRPYRDDGAIPGLTAQAGRRPNGPDGRLRPRPDPTGRPDLRRGCRVRPGGPGLRVRLPPGPEPVRPVAPDEAGPGYEFGYARGRLPAGAGRSARAPAGRRARPPGR